MVTREKIDILRRILLQMGKVVVAYSGGVDSTFLLKVAVDTLGSENAEGILAISPSYPSREYEKALDAAKSIGAKIKIIHTKETDNPKFINNPADRCYFCKSELFDKIGDILVEENINNMVDGSNFDDLSDHRPGMKALKERNVRSPLQEAGFLKSEIRELSRKMGLPTWDKDALACLSSRFPYGETITIEKLRMVDEAENFLADLGFRNIRARHEKNTLRIEVSPAQIGLFTNDETRLLVLNKMKSLGYRYVTIDLEGYRQGSLNHVVPAGSDFTNLKIQTKSA